MKIADLLADYDKITNRGLNKTAKEKRAFVPNPAVAQQQAPPQGAPPQDPQAAQQQQAPPPQDPQAAQQQAPPQGAPPQQAPPQGAPPQDPQAAQQQAPPQGAPPQQGQGDASDGLLAEIMAAVQQMPPEAQQQIAPILAKLQNMPTEQREQHLSELLQELQQSMGGQQGMGGPQQPPGMEAQAADEDLYAAAQQQGLGALGGQEEMPTPPQDPAAEDAQQAEASAIEAKNELDNVKVTLSVRELLDLIGKGSATASLLKVKQLADTHKQKMDQTKAKAESEQQKQTQEQQQQAQEAQQGMMGGGGIYSAPMGG